MAKLKLSSEQETKKVTVLTEQDKKDLIAKTPRSLPDNPSDKQFSAGQIRNKLSEGYLILFDWLRRLSEESNTNLTLSTTEIEKIKKDLLVRATSLQIVEENESVKIKLVGVNGNVLATQTLPAKIGDAKAYLKRIEIDKTNHLIKIYNRIDEVVSFPYTDPCDPYTKTRISKYLYEVDFADLDYEYGKRYIEEKYKPVAVTHNKNLKQTIYTRKAPACSSARLGKWYGRNLDWYYDHGVEFVTRTRASDKRFASIGVCGAIPEFTDEFVESDVYSEIYKAIPFLIVDGINEKGVFVNTNVVHTEKGTTTGTIPTGEKKGEICTTMLPRFILDNYETALEAIEDIIAHYSVYANKVLLLGNMDAHFMIGDRTTTYVLEFYNNQIVYREINVMTNFHLYDVTLNEDWTVYTPEDHENDPTHDPVKVNNIEDTGMGLERFNILIANANASTKEEFINVFTRELDYRKSYSTFKEVSNPYWYTEFCERYQGYNCFVNSPLSNFERPIKVAGEMFAKRSRDDGNEGTWHTTHTAIYDIEELKLSVFDSTEDHVEHRFNLVKYYTGAEIDEKFENFNDVIFNIEVRPNEETEEIEVVSPNVANEIRAYWENKHTMPRICLKVIDTDETALIWAKSVQFTAKVLEDPEKVAGAYITFELDLSRGYRHLIEEGMEYGSDVEAVLKVVMPYDKEATQTAEMIMTASPTYEEVEVFIDEHFFRIEVTGTRTVNNVAIPDITTEQVGMLYDAFNDKKECSIKVTGNYNKQCMTVVSTYEEGNSHAIVCHYLDKYIIYTSSGYTGVTVLATKNSVDNILALIPAQASAQNQLGDKDFINSSIATNTANYIYKIVEGEKAPFDNLVELETQTLLEVTNNDYAFVKSTDIAGNTIYTRYKATKDEQGNITWAKEYVLNNSGFTAIQFASINSGITSAKVTAYDNHITDTNVHVTNAEKQKLTNAVSYIEITYSALKTLRDNNQLVKGTQYRITDYSTIIYSDSDVQSAGHNFDIIVVADSENVLNENARAIQHSGDTYFANNKLSAWKLKYSLDNDTNRFAWANASGKGVIYEMIDEFNNKCPYDFKNIQFKRYKLTATTKTATDLVGTYSGYKAIDSSSYYPSNFTIDKEDFVWRYTFSKIDNSTDGSLGAGVYNNVIKSYYNYNNFKFNLNNIVFEHYYTSAAGANASPYNNKFATNCRDMNFHGEQYYSCHSNTFGNSCSSNTFGNYCHSNTFGNYCHSNTFGNSCSSNTFGNYCQSNTFGNYCQSNTLLDNAQHTETEQYARYNIFENGVSYVSLVSNAPTSTQYLQNIHITQGIVGTSASPKVITETRNLSHNVVYRPTGSEDKNI